MKLLAPAILAALALSACDPHRVEERSVEEFRFETGSARPKLEAELRAIPQLDAKSRDEMLRFLGGFFEDIATPEQVEKKLFKTCR